MLTKNGLCLSGVSLALAFLSEFSFAETLPYKNDQLPIDIRVEDLLGRMTMEEKIGQMNMVFCTEILNKERTGLVPGTIEKLFGEQKRGAVKNLGNAGYTLTLAPSKVAEMANEIQKYAIENTRLGIPVLVVENSIHGYNAAGATVFPQSIGMASSWDTQLMEEVGSAVAKEAKSCGVHQVYGPLFDVSRDPRWGRIEETYGEDPYLVSRLGVAMVNGLQGKEFAATSSVIATVLHFVAYGDSTGGLNTSPVDISERTLMEVFLAPFEAAVAEAKARSIMPALNEINGTPCHCDKRLLTGILKEKWGFTGYVVSDNSGIQRICNQHHVAADSKEAVKLAIGSGVDMNLYPTANFQETLLELVQEGQICQARINDAAGRILRIKFLLGLFDGKNIYTPPEMAERICDSDEHRQLALKAAHKSVVLLKNQNNLLPLNKENIKTIAVIGPNADKLRTGDYSGKSRHGVTVLEGIKNTAGSKTRVLFAEGCSLTGTSTEGFPAAIQAAQQADVAILVLGENSELKPFQQVKDAIEKGEITCGENVDRADLNLTGMQEQLVKAVYETGAPVVAVLLNGRPLSITWIAENVPAVLEGWYPGEEGGTAIADIIFGNCNPGGKLPVCFPRQAGQPPVYYKHVLKPQGYAFASTEPLYPFGYGLSYAVFRYSDLRISPSKIEPAGNVEVSVTVSNISERTGDEIVQLYVTDMISSVTTPVKKLQGFARITLEPQEEKRVKFSLGPKNLALLNQNLESAVESGVFKIMVGDLTAELQVTD